MVRKLSQALLLLTVAGIFTAMGFADQITLSNSTTGQVQFTGTTTAANVRFTGTTCSKGTDCVAGFGLYGADLGSYQIWITGGNLSLGQPTGDTYPVISGNAIVNFYFTLGAAGSLQGTLGLQELIGGSTKAPEFLGSFTASAASGVFAGAFPLGVAADTDFTVHMGNAKSVNQIYHANGISSSGYLSSGEVVAPTPEPATLGLLGSGMLTMAGLLKRRLQ
jgi:hypothetical protein